MRYILTILFFAVAANVFAADVTVSPELTADLQPPVFDQDLSQMTPEQFREFCANYNAGQVAAAHSRHAAYLHGRGGLTTKEINESSGSSNMRTGGGLGYGGFGGAGGYSGYSDGSQSAGGGGMPTNVRSSYENDSSSYQSIYPDLNDDGGGPISIINPYCYDYWHAGHYTIAHRRAPAPALPAAPAGYNLFE